MKAKICLLLFVFIFIQSCKNEPKKIEKTRMEKVMQVHDDLMPEMSTIGKLITSLEPKIDSTAADDKYKAAKDDLVAAYDYMMEWMKGFGEKFDSDEVLEGKTLSPEKETLLLEEEKKVAVMKKMMLGSIEKAENLLKQEE